MTTAVPHRRLPPVLRCSLGAGLGLLAAAAAWTVMKGVPAVPPAVFTWGILLSTLFWLDGLMPVLGEACRAGRESARFRSLPGLALVLGLGLVVAVPSGWRILPAETTLLGASSTLFQEHEASLPVEGWFPRYDDPVILTREPYRGALFGPFLGALVHGLVGFRPENLLLINAVAAIGALGCFGLILARWFGEGEARAGMLLLAANPLLVLAARSGGAWMPALTLALLAFLLFDLFLEQPDALHFQALIWTALVLAQAEGPHALPALLLSIAAWRHLPRAEAAKLPIWSGLWFPLGVLAGWHLLGESFPGLLQPENWPGLVDPAAVLAQGRQMLRFFAGGGGWWGVAPPVFLLGLLGGVVTLHRWREAAGQGRPGCLTGAAVVWHLSAALVLFSRPGGAGDPTGPVTTVQGIVFLPGLVTLAVVCLQALRPWLAGEPRLVAALLVLQLPLFWPMATRTGPGADNPLAMELDAVQRFLARLPPAGVRFLVTDIPEVFVPFRISASTFPTAIRARAALAELRRRRALTEVLVLQRCREGIPALSPPGVLLIPQARLPLAAGEFLQVSLWNPEPSASADPAKGEREAGSEVPPTAGQSPPR